MPNTYAPTLVRLPVELLRELKKTAAQEQKSLAQLLREASHFYLLRKAKKTNNWRSDPIWRLTSFSVKTGQKNLAKKIDQIVYGK